jgi:hypothetical protein
VERLTTARNIEGTKATTLTKFSFEEDPSWSSWLRDVQAMRTMKEYGALVDEKQVEVLADYLAQSLGKK